MSPAVSLYFLYSLGCIEPRRYRVSGCFSLDFLNGVYEGVQDMEKKTYIADLFWKRLYLTKTAHLRIIQDFEVMRGVMEGSDEGAKAQRDFADECCLRHWVPDGEFFAVYAVKLDCVFMGHKLSSSAYDVFPVVYRKERDRKNVGEFWDLLGILINLKNNKSLNSALG